MEFIKFVPKRIDFGVLVYFPLVQKLNEFIIALKFRFFWFLKLFLCPPNLVT